MNLGRGFHVPQEKGVVHNGDIWIPSTPDKPIVLQRSSNNVQSEVAQNSMGQENWMDLLGIYSGVLQNGVSNILPQEFDLCSSSNIQGGVALVETYNRLQQNNQDSAPVESYNQLPHNFGGVGVSSSVEHRHNIEDVSTMYKFGSLNQNPSDVVLPQKVHTLAELMGMRRASPNGSNYVVSNRVNYAVGGGNLQQNHALHASRDTGGYNLQETPNSEFSIYANYLNF